MSSEAASPSATAAPLIALCIPTCRRNALLEQCLRAVAALSLPENRRVLLMIADNDADGGARPVVDAQQSSLPFPLHYYVEAERGLSAVRNSLITAALERGAHSIAFLDDDERPGTEWLRAMAEGLEKHGAQVATGPVTSVSPSGEVLSAGRALDTGAVPRHVACNNVLFSSLLAGDQGLRFDSRFDFIGGEDFDFFERSQRLGNRHAWIAEARVFETVPPERSGPRYLAWRHYSGAASAVLRFRNHHSAPHTCLHFFVKAAGKFLTGGLLLLAAPITLSRDRARSAVKKIANGAGCIAALFNMRPARYR